MSMLRRKIVDAVVARLYECGKIRRPLLDASPSCGLPAGGDLARLRVPLAP
jgi:hypothetical protein